MAKMKFNQRERTFLTVCAAVVPIFILGMILPGPMRAYKASAQDASNARNALREANNLRALITDSQSTGDSFQDLIRGQRSQASAGDLISNVLTDLDLAAKAQTVSGNSTLSKNGLDTVQLTLSGVSLTELIDLVHSLQTQNNLLILEKIRYMRPSNAGAGLDCVMVFSSIKRGGGARGRA
jgi:hypothetical protein